MTREEFARAVAEFLGGLLVRDFGGAVRVTAGVMMPSAVRCVREGEGWEWRVETTPVEIVVHAADEVSLAGVTSPVPLVYALLAPADEPARPWDDRRSPNAGPVLAALGQAAAGVRGMFPHAHGYLLGEALDPVAALTLPGFDRVYPQWEDEHLGKRRMWVDMRRHLMHLELSGVLHGGEFSDQRKTAE